MTDDEIDALIGELDRQPGAMRTMLKNMSAEAVEMKRQIEALSAEVSRQWISVEDQLSKPDTEVIVCAGEAVTSAWYEDYEGGTWHLDHERIWTDEVTHWMPFPPPVSSQQSREDSADG